MEMGTQEYAKTQIRGEIKEVEQIPFKKFWRPDSTWIAKGIKFNVEYLRKNRLAFARPDKLYGIQWLGEIFPEAVHRILAGEEFTIDSFQKLGYYKYLVAQLNPICHKPEYQWSKAVEHNWTKKFCDLVKLCHNIKRDGMTAPLDMFMDNEYPIFTRGYRRLEILYQLGVKEVPVRIWRNEWLSKRFIPTAQWNKPGDTIHGTAIKQFLKYGYKSTDKYWVHYYTPRYDAHLQGRQKEKLKILEFGIKEGMSIDLWYNAFPRAIIYGVDNKPERVWDRLVKKDRIKIFNFDYTDPAALKAFARTHGPFDVIIDDGLHRPDPQRETFERMWPYINNNGLYVIEDLHPNYRKQHKGNITMQALKDNIDKIWTNHEIKSVAFYPNICFIEKA